jgi:adenylate kinase family enzyme
VQREDDKPSTVRARLELYTKKTAPLVEFYRERNLLHEFHGTESKVIYVDVRSWLTSRLPT